jgi:ABC-2 type transport system ATP-binding protein
MDEASRCDRVALMQGGRILEVDAPQAFGARYPLPLLAVTGGNRYRVLLALREYPHAHAVYPFGDATHYTDAREGMASATIAPPLREFLAERGESVDVAPIAAGIEDAFIALMRAPAA